MLNIDIQNDGIKLTNSIVLPFKCESEPGEIESPEDARIRLIERRDNVIRAFSKRLIASLERRMKACETQLMNHLSDIKYVSEVGIICWRIKSGADGHFYSFSYEAMREAIVSLKRNDMKSFFGTPAFIDQTIKALLNDPEQDHSDANGYKYSELVSILMEDHLFNQSF